MKLKNSKIIILSFFSLVVLFNYISYSNPILIRLSKWMLRLPKTTIVKTISKISFKELKFLTKAERVEFLLEKAYIEGRINPAYVYRLRTIYSKIPNGDKFLYLCLKDKACNPLKFADKANSWVYQYIIQHYPNIGSFRQLNQIIGDFAERFLVKFFERSGWQCINGKYRGNNGFDGLCIKTNFWGKVEDVLILESKAENSLLGKAQCGRQMSKACIVSILETLSSKNNQEFQKQNWLERIFSRNRYKEILKLVKKDNYRRRLIKFRSTPTGIRLEIYKIEDNGLRNIKVVKEEVINTNLLIPTTKQDKYFKTLVEESLKETLDNFSKK